MPDIINVSDIEIEISRKDIKHMYLTVYPPDGHVGISVPKDKNEDSIRAFIAMRLSWIRKQQENFLRQPRENPRKYITRESIYLWGDRYLLTVLEKQDDPYIDIENKKIILYVHNAKSFSAKEKAITNWQKSLLMQELTRLIQKWSYKICVSVERFDVRKMKNRWGSCTSERKLIFFNTELIKKPKRLIGYVVVHELIHLIEKNHNEKFYNMISMHFPRWREAENELNSLPIPTLNN